MITNPTFGSPEPSITIEFSNREVAQLASVLDEFLQKMENDDRTLDDKDINARYVAITKMYQKFLIPMFYS
jgi:hypothetical protein